MGKLLENIVICDALRTPFGHGNLFKKFNSADILAEVIKGLVQRNRLNTSCLSAVIAGSVMQNSASPNVARLAALKAGLPFVTTDYSVHCNCNSGFMAILDAVGRIATGMGDVYIAGGTESMSRYGFRLKEKNRTLETIDEIKEAVISHGMAFMDNFEIIGCLEEALGGENVSMMEIAEIMANIFGVSREEQDTYAEQSFRKALEAVEKGILENYIIPIDEILKDSYPLNRKRLLKRSGQFARAKVIFGDDNPVLDTEHFYSKHKDFLDKYNVSRIEPSVTIYNSCIPGDGAGACLITTEKKAKELGLTPKAKLINWAVAGVEPRIMGIGPAEAVQNLFSRPKTPVAETLKMEDFDIIEIHEAFAAQVLSVFKESEKKYQRKWEPVKINPYGGSLAYTHPLGATNIRLITNILSRFDEDESAKLAVACCCAGGGQGTAMVFERYS